MHNVKIMDTMYMMLDMMMMILENVIVNLLYQQLQFFQGLEDDYNANQNTIYHKEGN